jgi:hypothetical protein
LGILAAAAKGFALLGNGDGWKWQIQKVLDKILNM